jgi:hypothetical protein
MWTFTVHIKANTSLIFRPWISGVYPVIANNGGWMPKFKRAVLFFSVVLFLFSLNHSLAQEKKEISAHTKLSYIFLDQNGDRYSLPELYNVYSGFSLEELYLTGRFKTNSTFQLNLNNVNLDNRDLGLKLNLPDLLSLKADHQKSRFVFDRDGDIKSFRTRTSLGGTVKPTKFLKLNLDYSHQLKEGSRLGYVEENAGVLGEKYDQRIQNGKAGVQLKCGQRYLTLSHRILLFNSDLNDSLDRKTNRTEITLNTPLPADISVSLRYMREESILEKRDLKLKTDFLAGTIFHRISRNILVAFKSSFQRADNRSTYRTTDIGRAGLSLNYRISKKFETDWGYEYQNREDQYGEINTHWILLGAKASPAENLFVRGLYRFKTRKDPDFSTLIGEYDEDNKLFKVKYRPIDRVDIRMRYQDKTRENTDIDTKVESQSFSSNLLLDLPKDIGLTFYFSLLDWDFHNFATNYRTSNRTYGLTFNLKPIELLKLTGRANYLKLSKDLDIDKYSFSIGVSYEFLEGHGVEASFQRFGYEDMITSENDFDANVFKIGILKTINNF